jgi:hypothetical protein
MLSRLFGLGKPAPEGAGSTIDGEMPWMVDGRNAAEFALTNLLSYLIDAHKDLRRGLVESLMTATGALAGFAAQHAIWERVVRPGHMPEHGGQNLRAGAFVVATATSGEKFYFGDLLNAYLVPKDTMHVPLGPGVHTLWSIAGAAVAVCGRAPLTMGEVAEIFRHNAATIGSAAFGLPRLPAGHAPVLAPREALNAAWPAALEILERRDAPGARGLPVKPEHAPTVCALAAHKLIVATKDALDPALSMRILFEAAVPMSKIDPASVRQAA